MAYMGVSRSNLMRIFKDEEEEEEARRAYAARVGRKKKRGPWSSALKAQKKYDARQKKPLDQFGGQSFYGRTSGISPRYEHHTPVEPPPGGHWAGSPIQVDSGVFTGPGYQAHMMNRQNMAAFPGQVRGGGMPRRQERHAEEWAAFDQNVADRRQALGQMANWQTMQALPPELRLAYLQWMKEQENDQNLPDPNVVGIG